MPKSQDETAPVSKNGARSAQPSTGNESGSQSFPAIVRQTVPKMEGNFNRNDVAKQIERDIPSYAGNINPHYLRATLLKLANEGILKVVSGGTGKTLAVYRYIGGHQNQ